jgi:hypothetical protein
MRESLDHWLTTPPEEMEPEPTDYLHDILAVLESIESHLEHIGNVLDAIQANTEHA